jgi:hypothetical protein
VAARPLTEDVVVPPRRPPADGEMTAAMRREKLKRLEQSLFGYSGVEVGIMSWNEHPLDTTFLTCRI